MPLISDVNKKKDNTKKFKKKSYRPWDIYENSNKEEIIVDDHQNNKVTTTNEILEENTIPISTKDNSFLEPQFEKLWRDLYGGKKILFLYLLHNIEEETENILITKSIILDDLSHELKLPYNTVKAYLTTLKKINLIGLEENKRGRGGYVRFNIKRHIYSFFIKKINK